MTIISTPEQAWALLKEAERRFLAYANRPLIPPNEQRREEARRVMCHMWEIYHKLMLAEHGAAFSRFTIEGEKTDERRYTRYIGKPRRRAGQP